MNDPIFVQSSESTITKVKNILNINSTVCEVASQNLIEILDSEKQIIPKIKNFVHIVVNEYCDIDFKYHFRLNKSSVEVNICINNY